MRWRILTVLGMLGLALAIQGCCAVATLVGSDRVVMVEREVSDVAGVHLATVGTLYIELGDTENLRIEAEDRVLSQIEVEVKDGILRIATKPGASLPARSSVGYYLRVKALEGITASGSGDIVAPDLRAGRFRATVTGSGSIQMGGLDAQTVEAFGSGSGNLTMGDVDAGEVLIRMTGSGDFEMETLSAEKLTVVIGGSGGAAISEGYVEEQDIRVSGSGAYSARDLKSAYAEADLSGSGSATLRVYGQLTAVVRGSGSVRYVGTPTLDETVTGSGSVRRISQF